MQLILVFVLAVVVLGIVGTGLLAQPTNITLFVSALGFGEANLESPITNASIDLLLNATSNSEDPQAPLITIVSACAFHSDENIEIGTGKSEGKLVCKLLNADGNAIAEGDVPFSQYTASDTLRIRINQPAFLGATNFALVDDAMIIIQGPL